MVAPVALYGCEVWGPYGSDIVSRVQLRYYKYVLKLNKTTSTNMLLGELGKLPIREIIKSRVLNFWFKTVTCKNDRKLSNIMYKTMYSMYINKGDFQCDWLKYVKNSLDELGLSFIWLAQGALEREMSNWFKNLINVRIKDQFLATWQSKVFESQNCTNYRLFKLGFTSEKYLKKLPTFLAINMLRFRCRNTKLPVVSHNFDRVLESPKCSLCNANEIGDEFHFILKCEFFREERKNLLGKYVIRGANSVVLTNIMCTQNVRKLVNLSRFMRIIMSCFR